MIRLGYSCSNLTLGRAQQSVHLAQRQTQEVSSIQSLLDENLDLLVQTLHWNRDQQIQVYRLSPYLVPLNAPDGVKREALNGARVRDIAEVMQGMRLSMHPGQYIAFSAEGDAWQRSYQDLCAYASVLDQLGISEGDLVLHTGSVPGTREAIAGRIIAHIRALPDSVRRHLRLENDERFWSVNDLLPICEATGIPLIADILHHQLNGNELWPELPWTRILATWRGRRPKLHYSEQDPTKQPGAHSAYVDAERFQQFMAGISFINYDVMLECKGKELALLKLRQELHDARVLRTFSVSLKDTLALVLLSLSDRLSHLQRYFKGPTTAQISLTRSNFEDLLSHRQRRKELISIDITEKRVVEIRIDSMRADSVNLNGGAPHLFRQ